MDGPAPDAGARPAPAFEDTVAVPPAVKLARRALASAVALGAFLAAAALVRATLPWPGGAGVEAKWAWLGSALDDYDVVLIGSSRVYRSFAPRAIERELDALGEPRSVFNAAAPGVGALEADWLARALLEREPRRLSLLVLELQRFEPDEMRGNELARRAVHWHGPRQVAAGLRACWRRADLPGRERVRLALLHLDLGARKLASFGRGPELVAALGAGPSPAALAEARESGGYRPLEAEPFADVRERRAEFAEERERFAELFERRRADLARRDAASLDLAALSALARAGAARGVRIALVVPPGDWDPPVELLATLDPPLPLVSYADPERHPFLYDPDQRFDRFHLTAAAAQRLSRLLARDLLPHLPPARRSR